MATSIHSRDALVLAVMTIVTVLIGGVLTPSAATAATYYVATNGNDNNSCMVAQNSTTPKRSISSGLRCLGSGDTLDIRGGTYAEEINGNTIPFPSGTSDTKRTIIQGHAGETITLRPTTLSSDFILGPAGSPSAQWITFKNFVVDGAMVADPNTTGLGLWGGASRIRFQDIEVKNTKRSGVDVGWGNGFSSDFNEFLRLYIHDVGLGPNGGHAIYIRTSDNLVDGCTIQSIGGWGIHIVNSEGGGQFDSRNTARNNKVWNVGLNTARYNGNGAGIVLGGGDRNMAYNNIVYNSPYGLQIGFGAVNPTNTSVYNNTLYNNGYGLENRSNSSGAIIRNNLVYGGSPRISDSGSNTTRSNNLCDVAGTGCALVGDPKFVSSSNIDLRLQATSPAIDAGVATSIVTTDFAGASRPQGGGYDIGAYEYSSAVILSTPTNLRIIP
jgi:Right handed beta helix region